MIFESHRFRDQNKRIVIVELPLDGDFTGAQLFVEGAVDLSSIGMNDTTSFLSPITIPEADKARLVAEGKLSSFATFGFDQFDAVAAQAATDMLEYAASLKASYTNAAKLKAVQDVGTKILT